MLPENSIEEDQVPFRVLLVDDNKDFATLVQIFLRRHEPQRLAVEWCGDGPSALETAGARSFDAILMDYFMPGMNGLEITKKLRERGIQTPIVFLTVNKDFDLAVEVMKIGASDYLLKEDATTPVLPATILKVIERHRLQEQHIALEITQKRLEKIQEMVLKIAIDLRSPLDSMRTGVDTLMDQHANDQLTSYLTIIRDNLLRIEKKIVQLKDMKSDRTVPYIRDIRMFDLSE